MARSSAIERQTYAIPESSAMDGPSYAIAARTSAIMAGSYTIERQTYAIPESSAIKDLDLRNREANSHFLEVPMTRGPQLLPELPHISQNLPHEKKAENPNGLSAFFTFHIDLFYPP